MQRLLRKPAAKPKGELLRKSVPFCAYEFLSERLEVAGSKVASPTGFEPVGLNNGPLIPKYLDSRDHVFEPIKPLVLRRFAAKLRVKGDDPGCECYGDVSPNGQKGMSAQWPPQLPLPGISTRESGGYAPSISLPQGRMLRSGEFREYLHAFPVNRKCQSGGKCRL
jgi:hypothetical protein